MEENTPLQSNANRKPMNKLLALLVIIMLGVFVIGGIIFFVLRNVTKSTDGGIACTDNAQCTTNFCVYDISSEEWALLRQNANSTLEGRTGSCHTDNAVHGCITTVENGVVTGSGVCGD
jgi:hypothetical protein